MFEWSLLLERQIGVSFEAFCIALKEGKPVENLRSSKVKGQKENKQPADFDKSFKKLSTTKNGPNFDLFVLVPQQLGSSRLDKMNDKSLSQTRVQDLRFKSREPFVNEKFQPTENNHTIKGDNDNISSKFYEMGLNS